MRCSKAVDHGGGMLRIDVTPMVPFVAMTIRVRAATPADAEAIAAIYRPFVVDNAISFETEPPDAAEIADRITRISATHPWLVAVDETGGDRLLGYAYGTVFRTRSAYRHTVETAIYLHPDARGTGLADTLGNALHDDLQNRGFRMAIAVITLPNPASVAYHERLGYRPAGVLPSVGLKFDAWHDVGLWTLDLGAGSPRRARRGTEGHGGSG
jgi:L-amino acid N-acyltransferase YncA